MPSIREYHSSVLPDLKCCAALSECVQNALISSASLELIQPGAEREKMSGTGSARFSAAISNAVTCLRRSPTALLKSSARRCCFSRAADNCSTCLLAKLSLEAASVGENVDSLRVESLAAEEGGGSLAAHWRRRRLGRLLHPRPPHTTSTSCRRDASTRASVHVVVLFIRIWTRSIPHAQVESNHAVYKVLCCPGLLAGEHVTDVIHAGSNLRQASIGSTRRAGSPCRWRCSPHPLFDNLSSC